MFRGISTLNMAFEGKSVGCSIIEVMLCDRSSLVVGVWRRVVYSLMVCMHPEKSRAMSICLENGLDHEVAEREILSYR